MWKNDSGGTNFWNRFNNSLHVALIELIGNQCNNYVN